MNTSIEAFAEKTVIGESECVFYEEAYQKPSSLLAELPTFSACQITFAEQMSTTSRRLEESDSPTVFDFHIDSWYPIECELHGWGNQAN